MTHPIIPMKLQEQAQRIINADGILKGRCHGPICDVDNVAVFKRLTRTDLQQSLLINLHHRPVLFFNLGTVGVLSLDGVLVDLNPGEAVMILPFQFYSFPLVEEESMLWVMVSFETSSLELLEVFRNKSFRVSDVCFDLLGQVVEDFSHAESDTLNVIHSLKVSLLLHHIREQLECEGGSNCIDLDRVKSESTQLVAEIEKVLLSSNARMTRVEDIANALGVSASHLRATFRGHFNITLGSFIRHFRLNQAADMLANSTMSLTSIAASIGFSSPSTFTRFFRNSLGMTPKDYRNVAKYRYTSMLTF